MIILIVEGIPVYRKKQKNSVARVKEVKLKQKTEPLMNSEILQNIRYRDETLNKFRKTNDPDLYKKYCQLRNLVQRENRISKRDYLTNKIEENVGNSKKTLGSIKKNGYSSKKKESSNVALEIDGETCFDPKKVANCFYGFFTTVAPNLVDKLPSSFNLFHTESSTFQNFYKGKNVEDDEFMLAVRFIKNLGPKSHIGFLELNSLNMLNVAFRVKQLRLSHVHKVFNGTGPSYLSEQFIKVSDVHYHFTKGSPEIFIVPTVNGVAATTFYYSGIKDWNSLSSDVKQKCTFNGFKSAARQYLRSQLQLMESDTYVYY